MQFTTIGFRDTQERTNYARKDLIFKHWGLNVDKVELSDLKYSPLKSVIFARLYYLLIQSPIPTSLEGRANYWKMYYNTAKGAGTVTHYIKQAKANVRPNIIAAF
jgi:hypothetical protein